MSALATLAVAESVERLLTARTDEPSLVRLDRVEAAREAVIEKARSLTEHIADGLHNSGPTCDETDALFAAIDDLDRAEGR